MARFPRTEAEIEELARLVAAGLRELTDRFPAPPVAVEDLETSLERFRTARQRANEAAVEAQLATREKREALKHLVSELKTNVRYAENTCDFHHTTLKRLGWGGRRPKSPMERPGRVEGLKIVEEGPGWIELAWRKPQEGGPVQAYRIERSSEGGGKWSIAGMATGTSVRIEDQERGVQWMYRVVAVNAAGEGAESVEAEAVL